MFKTVFIVVLIVLAMALAGWITFHSTPTRTTVTIETSKIKEDSSQVLEKGEKIVEQASRNDPDAPPVKQDQRVR